MNRSRYFAFGFLAIHAGGAWLVACSSSEPDAAVDAEQDAAETPDVTTSEQPDVQTADAGAGTDADAAPPAYDASDEQVVCSTTPCVTQLVAGANQFCALISDGTVRCWGRDTQGSLGRGPDAGAGFVSGPAPVVDLANATQLGASPLGFSVCTRTADSHVRCWGDNTNAQLGLGSTVAVRDGVLHATPASVDIAADLASVAVGPQSACAVATNGDLYCWGNNTNRIVGRLDAGTNGFDVWVGPALADRHDFDIRSIAIGYKTAFGVTADHRLVSWGAVTGRQSSLLFTEPLAFTTTANVTNVGTAGIYAEVTSHCFIDDGRVYCWGKNTNGVLGTGFPDDERLPTTATLDTDGGAFPQQLALSASRSCVRMTDGTIQCTGSNPAGQLGRDAGGTAWVFGRVERLDEPAVRVAASGAAVCALIQGGKVVCWGGNTNGELGQGTTDNDAHPDPVTVQFQ